MGNRTGVWGMACWNGLSEEQRTRLVQVGNLPIGYTADGWCPNGAECEVTTMYDASPGPRFYCTDCAARYLRSFKAPRRRRRPGADLAAGQGGDVGVEVVQPVEPA